MKATRIKICGITRVEDALAVEASGADAIGFVFVARSKRCVSLQAAVEIASQLGPFVQQVGLFLDPSATEVDTALAAMPGLMPQFHGRETAEFCDSFGRSYLKAIGVAGGMPDAATLAQYAACKGFLFDSNAPGQLGGTGHTFDWQLLKGQVSEVPLILAGGLDGDNVSDAIASVRPYAVDVSTGVELSPGLKDPQLIHKFVSTVRCTETGLDQEQRRELV